jgi:hypothetical protein
MASGTADLQRDLGGAIMQSIFGALLAVGYTTSTVAVVNSASQSSQATTSTINAFEMSYSGAQSVAEQYPQYADQITAAAKTAFLAGDSYAYMAGIVAVLVGAALVYLAFPKKDEEQKLLALYHDDDV